MRLESVLPTADCSHHSFQAFAPSVSSSPFTSSFCSNPFASKTLLKSRSLNKIAKGNNHAVRRSCSLNLDGESSFRVEGSAKNPGGLNRRDKERNRNNKKLHCEISKKGSFLDTQWRDQDPLFTPRFDFLEPMILGVRPEFPDWPDHETTTWATIEHKAKSLDIPLSLRMIKKKLQLEEGFANSKESESCYCSIKAAFSSMVFIIVQLQSCALQMREELCHEDLEAITSNVQKEMHSSFVWLFQQVFSRTPALMLHVMVLLADFGVHSASYNTTISEASLLGALGEGYQQINGSLPSLVTIEEKAEGGNLIPSIYQNDQLESVEEMSLWDLIVDDATKMKEGVEEKALLDHETLQHFVAPVSVELEPDTYEDYLRTNLLYQMNLSHEPNNPLLLCNYAQFLHLVARDYHRAEECFKRAVQVKPPDAESLTQYANFLWTVRKEYSGAEDNFLQALALDPQNAYYASRYANFLWSTGGEETCFPLDNSHNPNV